MILFSFGMASWFRVLSCGHKVSQAYTIYSAVDCCTFYLFYFIPAFCNFSDVFEQQSPSLHVIRASILAKTVRKYKLSI